MEAMGMISMAVFGVAPLAVGVGVGSLAMRGLMATLEVAIGRANRSHEMAQAAKAVPAPQVVAPIVEADTAVFGSPAVVIPFGQRRARTAEAGAEQTRIAA